MQDRDLKLVSGQEVRQAARSGVWTRPTSGLASGYVQANLAIVPKSYALDFLTFCLRNPKPCPIVEVCSPGNPEPHLTAPGADIRTDVPSYRIYKEGQLAATTHDITSYWQDDFVAVLLGCSFTFEWSLLTRGIPIAHIDQGRNVPMYRTNMVCASAGPFQGPLVVSMRPFPSHLVPAVVAITQRFPSMHGGPVWIGNPEGLGVRLDQPDFGDAVDLNPDDVPVFWACGVTPQAVALSARIPLVVTHDPGHMFVTDQLNSEYEV